MSQAQSGSEAAAAALVGSLSTFSLIDVLDLLARTGHTGELQVVGRGLDRHVWVDQGDLVDASGSGGLSEVLFELACRDEGWFYFSATDGVPEGAERLTVTDVLVDLGPQVEEWRALVSDIPFDSIVSMSTTTPSDEVQIKGSQWQLLSTVGSSGKTVREVVDTQGGAALDTLRTLGELVAAGLLSVTAAPEGSLSHLPDPPPMAAPPPPPPPPDNGSSDTLWREPQVPPPEAGSRDRDMAEPPLPPFVPPAPEGWQATTGDEAAAASAEGVDEASAVMPPPVAGDPWSSSLTAEDSAAES